MGTPLGAVRAIGPFIGGNVSELPAPSATRLKSPTWLDGRLVIGVVLVLLSVVVGAKIISSSQRYDVMWAASRDIAPGTTLIKSDLIQVDVRFKDHGAVYISAAGASPVGRVTVSPLANGQLILLAAVPSTPPPAVRLVTIPVERLHMPRGNDLHGVQVDFTSRRRRSTVRRRRSHNSFLRTSPSPTRSWILRSQVATVRSRLVGSDCVCRRGCRCRATWFGRPRTGARCRDRGRHRRAAAPERQLALAIAVR